MELWLGLGTSRRSGHPLHVSLSIHRGEGFYLSTADLQIVTGAQSAALRCLITVEVAKIVTCGGTVALSTFYS